MNQWFEKPGDAQPWVFDTGVDRPTRRPRRGLAESVAIGALAMTVVFLVGMAFTNRGALPRYYPNCAWAKFVGVAPIPRGERGYRQALDTNNNGFACEPYQDL